MNQGLFKKYVAESRLSYTYHACAIAASYFLGLIIGNFLAVPFLTGTGAVIFMIGGAVLAFPLLLIALLILPPLKRRLEVNIRTWCLIAPFVVTISWLILEWSTNYSNRASVFEYLSFRNVWERATLAFLCSGSSAVLYFYLIKQALTKKEKNELQTYYKQK